MSTLTYGSHAPANAGLSYTQNVGRAARALLAALLAVPVRKDGASVTVRRHEYEFADAEQIAARYESVMPNLAQELRVMAARRD